MHRLVRGPLSLADLSFHSNLNLCRAFWRPAVEIAFAPESVLVSARFLTAQGSGLVPLRLRTLRAMAKGGTTKTKEWEMDR